MRYKVIVSALLAAILVLAWSAGPAVAADMRVVPREPAAGETPHITRGGAWSLPDWVGRLCCRGFHTPIRLADLGLRLARSL